MHNALHMAMGNSNPVQSRAGEIQSMRAGGIGYTRARLVMNTGGRASEAKGLVYPAESPSKRGLGLDRVRLVVRDVAIWGSQFAMIYHIY